MTLVSCCHWTNPCEVSRTCHTGEGAALTHHPHPPTHFHSDLAAENFLWLTQSILKSNITFERCTVLLRTLTSAKRVPRERLPVVLKHQPVKPTNNCAIGTVRRSKWKLLRRRVLKGQGAQKETVKIVIDHSLPHAKWFDILWFNAITFRSLLYCKWSMQFWAFQF